MERALQSALLRRSTMYRDLSGPVLFQLCYFAKEHDFDAVNTASSFDKFMNTTGRKVSDAITLEDVSSFIEDSKKRSQQIPAVTSAPSVDLFWRDASRFAPSLLQGLPRQNENPVQPKQRISPYLTKSQHVRTDIEIQPQSTSTVQVQAPAYEVIAILNNHIQRPEQEMNLNDREKTDFELIGTSDGHDAKYMMNRIEDKVAYLEGRINSLENALEEAGVQLCSVAQAAQQTVTVVGRICCDTEKGRLNPQSVLLEGSIRLSEGSRARLDLSNCPSYRIFPGQVVAVRGVNPSGHCIVASEVIGGLPLPLQHTEMQKLQEFSPQADYQGLSVVIASGPYTSYENLLYEPLQALLDYCTATPPHLLLLLGPFVDGDHPLVQAGLIDETFEELFDSRVLKPLRAFSSSHSTTCIKLMPSLRDVHHHPVFPQQPFNVEEDKISSLASPATFRCNEAVFACTSVDWLLTCSSQEISKVAGRTDRLSALAAHQLLQRNYLPMFPAPPSLSLDCSNPASLDLPCSPDLLLVPSDLQPFAKLVSVQAAVISNPCTQSEVAGGTSPTDISRLNNLHSNVVCINPGRLIKGTSGGTFAHLYISSATSVSPLATKEMLGTTSSAQDRIDQRCRVEIRRL